MLACALSVDLRPVGWYICMPWERHACLRLRPLSHHHRASTHAALLPFPNCRLGTWCLLPRPLVSSCPFAAGPMPVLPGHPCPEPSALRIEATDLLPLSYRHSGIARAISNRAKLIEEAWEAEYVDKPRKECFTSLPASDGPKASPGSTPTRTSCEHLAPGYCPYSKMTKDETFITGPMPEADYAVLWSLRRLEDEHRRLAGKVGPVFVCQLLLTCMRAAVVGRACSAHAPIRQPALCMHLHVVPTSLRLRLCL